MAFRLNLTGRFAHTNTALIAAYGYTLNRSARPDFAAPAARLCSVWSCFGCQDGYIYTYYQSCTEPYVNLTCGKHISQKQCHSKQYTRMFVEGMAIRLNLIGRFALANIQACIHMQKCPS